MEVTQRGRELGCKIISSFCLKFSSFFCACFFLEFLKIEAKEKPLKTSNLIVSNHLFKRFRYRRKAGTIQLNTTYHSKLCIVMLMLHGSQNIVNYFRITFSFSDCEKNRDTDCEMLFVRNYFNNHLVLH